MTKAQTPGRYSKPWWVAPNLSCLHFSSSLVLIAGRAVSLGPRTERTRPSNAGAPASRRSDQIRKLLWKTKRSGPLESGGAVPDGTADSEMAPSTRSDSAVLGARSHKASILTLCAEPFTAASSQQNGSACWLPSSWHLDAAIGHSSPRKRHGPPMAGTAKKAKTKSAEKYRRSELRPLTVQQSTTEA